MDTQAGIKDRDRDLALLNSLRGKWVVFAYYCAENPETIVILTDTREEARAVEPWAAHNCPYQLNYIGHPIDDVAQNPHFEDYQGLPDRLREIVNERGMVREEVGDAASVPAGTLPE